MLDYNSTSRAAEAVNAAIDSALQAANMASLPRDYLGGSRLGHACERALQFEFLHAPKDEGADFSGNQNVSNSSIHDPILARTRIKIKLIRNIN